jgi:hypothetical protein
MLDKKIQERIDQLYRDMKPLQEYYGIQSRTIEQRYQDHKNKQLALTTVPRPRFKLPKL